jgi:ligand-binding SRPBCC domain-containing protein
MRAHRFEAEQRVPRPLVEVFEFFSRADNLEQITPPWLSFTVQSQTTPDVRTGTEISYRLKLHGVPMGWVSRIEEFERDVKFVDRQIKGPFRLWHHQHTFEADGDGTIIRDLVRYQLPFGLVGAVSGLPLVRYDVERIFAYRRRVIGELFG